MLKNPNALKFIHLTDCLAARNLKNSHGRQSIERFRVAIDSINADQNDADFVVITGSVRSGRDDEAYELLARELRRLTIPFHFLVGNYTNARAFRFWFPDAQRCENGFVQGSKRTPFGLCLFLDSSQIGSSKGNYCTMRRQWLRGVLEQTTGPVMLFMHHTIFEPDDQLDHHRDLLNSDDCSAMLAPFRNRIRHIFVGQVDEVDFNEWHGIPISGMGGVDDPVLPALAGSHLRPFNRLNHPNYGLVLIDDKQVTIHQHPVSDHSPRIRVSG